MQIHRWRLMASALRNRPNSISTKHRKITRLKTLENFVLKMSTGEQAKSGRSKIEGDDAGSNKSIMERVVAQMREMGVEPSQELPAEKLDSGSLGKVIILDTNVHGIRLPNINIHRYHVTIEGETDKGKVFELTKSKRDDVSIVDRTSKCFWLLKHLEKGPFFNQAGNIFYDGQKMLCTTCQLSVSSGGEQVFVVDGGGLSGLNLYGVKSVKFRISEVEKDSKLTLNDLSFLSERKFFGEQMLAQFVNLATSQLLLRNPDYFLSLGSSISYIRSPESAGMDSSRYRLREGKYISVGIRKSLGFVEGPKGHGYEHLAMIVDVSKTAFHEEECVLEKITKVIPNILLGSPFRANDVRYICKQLKGLYAETRYNDDRKKKGSSVFRITDVSARGANQITFEWNDGVISIYEYYVKRYGVELKYPKAPMLVSKVGEKIIYFPVELSYILPGQRVMQSHQTPNQLKDMRNTCIIPPAQRKQELKSIINYAQFLAEDNSWVAGIGLKIIANTLKTNGRLLPLPKQIFGSGGQFSKGPHGGGKKIVYRAAGLTRWVVFGIDVDRDLGRFANDFARMGKNSGMQISAPITVKPVSSDYKSIRQCFEYADKSNCDLMLFIENDHSDVHDLLKFMERKFQILTQSVRASTLTQIIHSGRPQTLENIIYKTNVKLGGHNYLVRESESGKGWYKPGDLIIGLSTYSLSIGSAVDIGSRRTTAVGYSANIGEDHFEFIGDVTFQEGSSASNAQLILTLTRRIVGHYQKRRCFNPKRLIVYRSGMSEAQYELILRLEAPLIRRGLIDCGCVDVPLTVIIVTRSHSVRLMPAEIDPKARATDQNLMPGIVCDAQVVHPYWKEFFLCSHKTLQGTASVPKYTVICDESNLPMDEIEMLTYALCYCYQIIIGPVSVPAPLYIATLYADRGNRLSSIKRQLNKSSCDELQIPYDGSITADSLNREITYEHGGRLWCHRINA